MLKKKTLNLILRLRLICVKPMTRESSISTAVNTLLSSAVSASRTSITWTSALLSTYMKLKRWEYFKKRTSKLMAPSLPSVQMALLTLTLSIPNPLIPSATTNYSNCFTRLDLLSKKNLFRKLYLDMRAKAWNVPLPVNLTWTVLRILTMLVL